MGDVRTTTGQKPPETMQQRRSKLRRALRIVVALLLAIGAAGHFIKLP